MRFGLASDSSDQDDLVSLASSFTSEGDSYDEDEGHGSRSAKAGPSRTIKSYIESDSEGESAGASPHAPLDGDVITIGGRTSANGTAYSTNGDNGQSSKKAHRKMKARAPPSLRWRSSHDRNFISGAATNQRIDEGDWDWDWAKVTDEMAIREGQRLAHERSSQLRQHLSHIRAELREAQGMRDTAAADEISKLLEGIKIRSAKEEEEAARLFAEREKRLWADIDAAILQSQRAASEARRAILDAEEKKKAEEEAQRNAALQQAQQKAAAEEQKAQEQKAQIAREEAAKAKLEEERQMALEAKRAAAEGGTGSEWTKWVEVQKKMKKDVIEVVKSGGKGKLRAGMRLITRGLGQAVNSRARVVQLTDEICALLNPHLPAPPTPASPTSMSSPAAYLYLLSHIAKALIKQAENEISAKSEAAFPLASIVVGLLLRGHAPLGDILFARLVKKCPWVVPFYPSRAPNQPRAEYEKSTGQGADESTGDYIIRMGGILVLYFAILQTPLGPLISTLPNSPTPDSLPLLVPAPLRLPAGWSWISHIAKEPLRSTPAAAHLINMWVVMVAPALADVYGPEQVGKILRAIHEEGIEGGVVKGDTESSRQQLALAVQGWRAGNYHEGRSWDA